jgi:L-malate glycosyltransferase
MKIIWFINIPNNHIIKKYKLNIYDGSWIGSIEKKLIGKKDISLIIISFSNKKNDYYKYKNIFYYNFNKKENGFLKRWLFPLDNNKYINICIKIIKDLNPNIIHIHGTEEFYGLITRKIKIPCVISVQGFLQDCNKKYLYAVKNNEILKEVLYRKGRFLRGSGYLYNKYIMSKRAKREIKIYKENKYFIGRTIWDRNNLNLINYNSKYFKCEEILRKDFYTCQKWNIKKLKKHRIIITLSPMHYKGLHILLEAINILKEGKYKNIKLVVIGNIINSNIWEYITTIIRQYNLEKNVNFIGEKSASQIAYNLRNASIFICSSFTENSSNSLMEAMIVGIPCIASYVGGTPSFLKNNINGMFFSPGDPFDLAGKIMNILENNKLAEKMSTNSIKTIEKSNEPDKIVKKLLNIYKKIIKIDK